MCYNRKRFVLTTLLFLACIHFTYAQNTFIEVGAGIGNVVKNKNARGKGELHLSILKSYKFGQLGIDFSTGGNFIPGITSNEDENTEVLSPNDFKFTAITVLYRLPIKKYLFIEPRLGYSSLFSFVHTDDKTRISQSNFAAGISIGKHLNNFVVSVKYQYLGTTPDYVGMKNSTIVKSNSESFTLLLFKISYRFDLKKFFQKEYIKKNE